MTWFELANTSRRAPARRAASSAFSVAGMLLGRTDDHGASAAGSAGEIDDEVGARQRGCSRVGIGHVRDDVDAVPGARSIAVIA